MGAKGWRRMRDKEQRGKEGGEDEREGGRDEEIAENDRAEKEMVVE